MRLIMGLKTIALLLTLAPVIYAIRTKQSHGTYAGVPFEFRRPTLQRIRERLWNPDDDRMFTPHIFGAGWSPNMYQILKRLGAIKTEGDDGQPGASRTEE